MRFCACPQGEAGTEVRLTVQPRGSGEQRQLALSRRQVKFNPVSSQLCSGGGGPPTGYIRVGTFSRQTVENLQAALRSLQVRFRALGTSGSVQGFRDPR